MAISITMNGRRYKAVITITAGTPIFAATGQMPIVADRLLIQMLHGGVGAGKVYDDVPSGMTADQVAAGGDVPVELAAATATDPGGTYTDAGPSIDLRQIAIDGASTGDTVLVDARLKV